MTLPIRSRLCDLFRRARNKIPPHQDSLRKRRPANQQYATSVSALELDNGTTCSEIPETRRIDRLTIDLCIACQQHCCVLKRLVQRKLQARRCAQRNLSSENM